MRITYIIGKKNPLPFLIPRKPVLNCWSWWIWIRKKYIIASMFITDAKHNRSIWLLLRTISTYYKLL